MTLRIALLWLLSAAFASQLHAEVMPRQDSESEWLTDHTRSYYTTSADGQKRLVLTNLDEHGNRMGPPAPSQPEQPGSTQRRVRITRRLRSWQPPEEPFYEDSDYPPYREAYPSYPEPQAYAYPPGFIPDYPGSSFGFHLFPQFTVIHPGFGGFGGFHHHHRH